MGQRRDWFKHDAWFLADDKIRSVGHRFGASGVLVGEAFLELAKRQRMAGLVEVEWSYLAEHAFVKNVPTTKRIVDLYAERGFIEIMDQDAESVRLVLPKWREIQGAGLSGAERTAAWRDRKEGESDDDVTSQNGHGDDAATSPHAGARTLRGRRENKDLKTTSSAASRTDQERERASDEDRANCRLFIKLLREHNPKAPIKSESEWLRQMRLLRERDDNSGAEIGRLIRWMFTNTGKDARFWASTVQSPAGLREHFAQIWAKMTMAETSAAPDVESSAALLARRGAA